MLLSPILRASASASRFVLELMILLDVTYVRLELGFKCVGSEMEGFKRS